MMKTDEKLSRAEVSRYSPEEIRFPASKKRLRLQTYRNREGFELRLESEFRLTHRVYLQCRKTLSLVSSQPSAAYSHHSAIKAGFVLRSRLVRITASAKSGSQKTQSTCADNDC